MVVDGDEMGGMDVREGLGSVLSECSVSKNGGREVVVEIGKQCHLVSVISSFLDIQDLTSFSRS